METTKPFDVRSSSAALWTGILAGPFAQALTLTSKYALVKYVCDRKAAWVLFAIAILGLAICAFGAFESWRGWRSGEETPRVQFMGISGLILNAGFALVIIAQAIPPFFLGPCE